LQAAVNEAYRHLLMHGEYPIAVVWVETDPDAVDVNIHPTKSQVKFQTPSLAFRAVAGALRSTLEKAPWLPEAQQPRSPAPLDDVMPEDYKSTQGLQNFAGMPAPSQPVQNLAFDDGTLHVTQFKKKDFSFTPPSGSTVSTPKIDYQTLASSAASRESFVSTENSAATGGGYWSSLEILGQANLTYIVTQSRDKMVFVDQHAAHERVVFEKLMAAWKGGKVDVQDFLFPLAIDMSPEKVEAILTYKNDIERLGVFIEALGPGTLGVKAAPLVVKESSLSSVLDKMAGEIVDQGGSFSLERTIGDICATIACHSVVRAGQALGTEQMKSLLRDMDAFPLSSFCPHGRPVSVEYPFYKLEKDFGRIV
jgi:DNA mismatch repair protein MutL